MTTLKTIELEDALSVPSYAKWPLSIVRGAGMHVYDADGNEYLDLYGGHCVTLLGHGHPRWVRAVATQAERLGFYSNVAYNDVRAAFLERLIDFAPEQLGKAFLANSGSEANETAVKLALKATGRSKIIAMEGGFHGRTAGALSLTHLGHYREQFPEVVRPVAAIPLGDLEALDATLDGDTAAVILEPVQSMNGVASAPQEYYPALVEVCHRNGTLVIFDEIQTGLGRLGAPFAADLFDAQVDLITLAKGIAGGFPMAAVLVTEAVASTVEVGEQGTTFGGGPLACAAGLSVLETIIEEDLPANARRLGDAAPSLLAVGPVTAVRGYGLLLGLETDIPARELAAYLRNQGVLIGTSADPHVARLMPPLNTGEEHLEKLAGLLAAYEPAKEPGEENLS
ncbi:MAG: aspartate aminotransferase family protein [Deltaproteobacteria bacterium]|nr:aspartate aminotransferase family protein [Deltaproteobacteria bacterium]